MINNQAATLTGTIRAFDNFCDCGFPVRGSPTVPEYDSYNCQPGVYTSADSDCSWHVNDTRCNYRGDSDLINNECHCYPNLGYFRTYCACGANRPSASSLILDMQVRCHYHGEYCSTSDVTITSQSRFVNNYCICDVTMGPIVDVIALIAVYMAPIAPRQRVVNAIWAIGLMHGVHKEDPVIVALGVCDSSCATCTGPFSTDCISCPLSGTPYIDTVTHNYTSVQQSHRYCNASLVCFGMSCAWFHVASFSIV